MPGTQWKRYGSRAGRAIALAAAALGILGATAPAAPAATIGQVSPSPVEDCNQGRDWLQLESVGGLSYVVPAGDNTITSWSTNAGPSADQELGFKVFRATGTPGQYKVVASDPPRKLVHSQFNTFAVNLGVQPGDILGLHTGSTGDTTACDHTSDTGDVEGALSGDILDEGTGMFTGDDAELLNVSAQTTYVAPLPSPPLTGRRTAALKRCKKLKHSSAKKRKKCKKRAAALPL